MGTLIVSEAELRECLALDETALLSVEQAFSWIAEGRVEMPPVMHIDVDPYSAVDAKAAYVKGLDHLAVKIATGFFRNPEVGLPSCSSAIALINARTGLFDCVFIDNGYLMDLRTGLAGAVAAKWLAPESVETVGVIGTGVQARYQIASLALVRQFKRVLAFGRNSEAVSRYCTEMTERLGIPVEPSSSVEALVKAADIVVTTTPATDPVVHSDWVHPGLHITAMGSDLPGKQELHADIAMQADILVCDVFAQCRVGGELQHMPDVRDDVVELGSITAGVHRVARHPDALTVCDLTGTGVQDTAIAVEAYARIRKAGLGSMIG